MRGVLGWVVSLLRLASRPGAWAVLLVGLLLLAAAGAGPAALSLAPELDHQVDPVAGPGGIDLPRYVDLSWASHAWRLGVGTLWGALGILALLLFAFGRAVLLRAGAGPWEGARAAWADAVRKAPAILLLAGIVLGGLAFVSWDCYLVLLPRANRMAAAQPSDLRSIFIRVAPQALWFLLTVPLVVAGDLGLARIVAAGKRSAIVAFGWGYVAAFRSLAPWTAAGTWLAADAAIVTVAWWFRPLWDPYRAATPWIALGGIVAILALRLLAHGAYLGALGRHARAALSANDAPAMPSPTEPVDP